MLSKIYTAKLGNLSLNSNKNRKKIHKCFVCEKISINLISTHLYSKSRAMTVRVTALVRINCREVKMKSND